MQIELTCNPTDDEAETLSRAIREFNAEAIRDLEPVEAEKRFHVLTKSESGDVLGGIRATCFWNTLHIELLWLSEELRGGGVGRQLVETAEDFARKHGCENSFVETTSWQARPFYEKNGYRHIATLNGRPRGHASHYLTKTLFKRA